MKWNRGNCGSWIRVNRAARASKLWLTNGSASSIDRRTFHRETFSFRWTRSFRTHVEEMFIRLRNGDIHVQISNATSRALTGDVGLSVSGFSSIRSSHQVFPFDSVASSGEREERHRDARRAASNGNEKRVRDRSDQLLRGNDSRTNQRTKSTEGKTRRQHDSRSAEDQQVRTKRRNDDFHLPV